MEKTYSIPVVAALSSLVLSGGLAIYGNWCGIGLTYDSHDYLAAAASFKDHFLFQNFNGDAYLFHAPFFPILLSLFEGDIFMKVKWMNILMLVVSTIVIYITNYACFRNKLFASLSVAFISLSVGQQMVYNFLWTEPLFIFFLALHNFFLVRFLNVRKGSDIIGLIVSAFFTAITRNAGFFIVLSVTWILLTSVPIKKRSALLYFLLATLGFGIWNVYGIVAQKGMENVYLSNLFFTDIWTNTMNYLDTISLWFMPYFIPFNIRMTILIVCFSYLNYFLLTVPSPKVLKVYLLQSAFYLIIMFVLIKVDADESERLLAVIYPWIILVLFLIFDQLWIKADAVSKRLLISCVVFCLIYNCVRTVNNASGWHDNKCQIIVGMNRELKEH